MRSDSTNAERLEKAKTALALAEQRHADAADLDDHVKEQQAAVTPALQKTTAEYNKVEQQVEELYEKLRRAQQQLATLTREKKSLEADASALERQRELTNKEYLSAVDALEDAQTESEQAERAVAEEKKKATIEARRTQDAPQPRPEQRSFAAAQADLSDTDDTPVGGRPKNPANTDEDGNPTRTGKNTVSVNTPANPRAGSQRSVHESSDRKEPPAAAAAAAAHTEATPSPAPVAQPKQFVRSKIPQVVQHAQRGKLRDTQFSDSKQLLNALNNTVTELAKRCESQLTAIDNHNSTEDMKCERKHDLSDFQELAKKINALKDMIKLASQNAAVGTNPNQHELNTIKETLASLLTQFIELQTNLLPTVNNTKPSMKILRTDFELNIEKSTGEHVAFASEVKKAVTQVCVVPSAAGQIPQAQPAHSDALRV